MTGSTVNFDNVMMKFIVNKGTDACIENLCQFVFFFYKFTCIIRPQDGEMLGINEGKSCCKLIFFKPFLKQYKKEIGPFSLW